MKTIGREMNVRYVLEGSVQRGASRMRLNVQLIDAETGNHLWADPVRSSRSPISLDMQDRNRRAPRGHPEHRTPVAAAEARRGTSAEPRPRWTSIFQGVAWLSKGLIPNNGASAQLFRSRAISQPRQCPRRSLDRRAWTVSRAQTLL